MKKIAAIILVLAVPTPPIAVHARDRGQFKDTTPEMRQWFENLRSGKGPCCADADGTVITDNDWDMREGRYFVRVPRTPLSEDTVWVPVPDEAIITEPNRVNRPMVWPYYPGGGSVTIRCFMPGTLT